MSEITEPLKNKDELIALLQSEVLSQQEKTNEQTAAIFMLQEQLKLALDRQFGKKSEKRLDNDPQAMLFDEADMPVDQDKLDAEEETMTVPAHERKKQNKKGRKPLPDNLERIRKEYDITDNEKVCACGAGMHCIGESTSEQLDYVPAKVRVIVHARKNMLARPVNHA